MSNDVKHDNAERLEALVARLSKAGRRITPQRLAILNALIGNRNHPTAEQIHTDILDRYPTTSLATVYKTITMLKEEGAILELEFSESSNRYDGHTPGPHPHVICSKCGVIVDPATINLNMLTERIAKETGFSIQSHRLDFYGLCPKCRQE